MTVSDDTPMTEEERFQAIAAILAAGVLRLHSRPALLATEESEPSSKERVENAA